MISRCSGLSCQPWSMSHSGEPVEQLRMRGRRAQLAKVVRRADDAAAEVMLPDAIDDHPRGEHVVGRGDPIGQHACGGRRSGRLSAARRNRRAPRRRTAREVRLDLVARARADCRGRRMCVGSGCGSHWASAKRRSRAGGSSSQLVAAPLRSRLASLRRAPTPTR